MNISISENLRKIILLIGMTCSVFCSAGEDSLTIDGDLYVRGNIELENSIRMRDHMIWTGVINGFENGQVAYLVLSKDDEYVWPGLEVTISGHFNYTLQQGSISKVFSFRHYPSGNLYGPVETEMTNNSGFLRRHFCIGEPNSTSDGVRIPIVYYDTTTSNNDGAQIRVKVEFSKDYHRNQGQPGTYTDWEISLTDPVDYDPAVFTDELLESWTHRKLYGEIELVDDEGNNHIRFEPESGLVTANRIELNGALVFQDGTVLSTLNDLSGGVNGGIADAASKLVDPGNINSEVVVVEPGGGSVSVNSDILINGNVLLAIPQGDISMGAFGVE